MFIHVKNKELFDRKAVANTRVYQFTKYEKKIQNTQYIMAPTDN